MDSSFYDHSLKVFLSLDFLYKPFQISHVCITERIWIVKSEKKLILFLIQNHLLWITERIQASATNKPFFFKRPQITYMQLPEIDPFLPYLSMIHFRIKRWGTLQAIYEETMIMQRSCFKKYISINPQAVFFVFIFVFRRNDVARNTLLKYFITKGSSFFFLMVTKINVFSRNTNL